MSELASIEAVLVKYAGPMGKFVLKKKVKEMGLEQESFSSDKLKVLINSVVADAIFDPDMQRKALGEMKQLLPTSC